MRRLNVREAFVGEPDGLSDVVDLDSDEALVLSVRGGQVILVVPTGTDERAAFDKASVVRGMLRLENEQILTFEIHDGAVGAFVEPESAELHRRRDESVGGDLSGISGSAYATVGTRARDVMTQNVVWVTPDISLPEVSRLLAFHNVSGFPVCDDGKLVGIVSEADVIWKVGSHVREIMSEEVVSVAEDTAIDEIARVMSQHKIKRVPVLRNGELVGIVSRADLVRAVATRA